MWRCRKLKFKPSWPAILARSFRQPQLSVSSSPGNIVLSWPVAQATFQLQSSATLAPASWANVATSPVSSGGMRVVTLPDAAGPQFFRLIGP